ncbi:MAG TPA: hypothetical protein ACYCDB_00805 [Candidatus Azoamicus sp.]
MYKIFLVGGSTRDKLITLKANEKDWLILNSNYQTISNLGFKLVGKDFPVFLHPITKEEYALARKERKLTLGYNGFKCYFFSSIKLKDDLFRRDITINSIILNKDGKIIDFFNGIIDIKNKKIRHISNAFFEDPLRVLRVARIILKYNELGFTLASKTYKLIKKMKKKEISKLTTERIIKEVFKSIIIKNSHVFFNIIKVCNKLKNLHSNLDYLINFSKKFKFNKNLDLWTNKIKLLNIIDEHTNNKFIKISIIINELRNNSNVKKEDIFNMSKKYIKFLLNLDEIKKNYNEISSKNLSKINDIIEGLILNKNKIKILNILLICEKFNELNSYTHNFYTKYLILEIINNIKKYININNINNNKLKIIEKKI